MKTGILTFKKDNLFANADYLKRLSGVFNGSLDIDVVEVLNTGDDLRFKRALIEFKDTIDNLIIVSVDSLSFDYKSVICEVFDTALAENENALDLIDKNKGSLNLLDLERLAQMPLEGTLIPNERGVYQGFLLEDKGFTLAVLPSDINQIKDMCQKFLFPYFDSKYNQGEERLTIKIFGGAKIAEQMLTEKKKALGDNFDFTIDTVYADSAIRLKFKKGATKRVINQTIKELNDGLKEHVYAEYDGTLNEVLFELLKLKKKKLSVAESFTGGTVVSSIIENSGASSVLHEGIVSYSNESKLIRLSVKEHDLEKHGAVSARVAFEMASGLLKDSYCDLAISTTGIAGPKSDNTQKPVGLCYIAIGDRKDVVVYKYKFNGDRTEITQTAKNTALFLAIRKLKK